MKACRSGAGEGQGSCVGMSVLLPVAGMETWKSKGERLSWHSRPLSAF